MFYSVLTAKSNNSIRIFPVSIEFNRVKMWPHGLASLRGILLAAYTYFSNANASRRRKSLQQINLHGGNFFWSFVISV